MPPPSPSMRSLACCYQEVPKTRDSWCTGFITHKGAWREWRDGPDGCFRCRHRRSADKGKSAALHGHIFFLMALEGLDLMPRHCVPRAEMRVPNLPMLPVPAGANRVAILGAVRHTHSCMMALELRPRHCFPRKLLAEMRVPMLPVSAAPNYLATFDPFHSAWGPMQKADSAI